jgi:hypothetical protein
MQAFDSARPTQCPSGFWFAISQSDAARTVARKAVSKLPGSLVARSDVEPFNIIGIPLAALERRRLVSQTSHRRIGNFAGESNQLAVGPGGIKERTQLAFAPPHRAVVID